MNQFEKLGPWASAWTTRFNRFTRLGVLVLLSVTSLAPQMATAAAYGVYARTTLFTPVDEFGGCRVFSSFGGIFCPGSDSNQDVQSVYQQLGTESRQDDATGAPISWAIGDLDTADTLPFLSAYATAGEREYSISTVEAVREYIYTGTTPFTLEVAATYHTLFSTDPSSDNPIPGTSMFGRLAIIVDRPNNPIGPEIEAALTAPIPLSSHVFISSSITDEDFDRIDNLTGDQAFELNVSADLLPGDRYFLYNTYEVSAVNGATADGLSSSSMSVNTLDYVAADLAPVPVPPALMLFASGVLGLVLTKRSRGSSTVMGRPRRAEVITRDINTL